MTEVSDFRIRDISFDGETDPGGIQHEYVWRTDINPDDIVSGSDCGQLVIRIDVDGQLDIVCAELGSTGELPAIDRAITALQKIREGLAQVYGGRMHSGTCLDQGGWGRCRLRHGHEGDHSFPTEEQWRQMQVPGPRSVA